MIIKVLGSAAGGGFPQVNCNCRNCADVRAGRPGFPPRTQSSLAVSRDGERWVLLNASPDLRQQIAATPELAPRAERGLRSSPIKAVVLTNGDVDHVAGLLSLREGVGLLALCLAARAGGAGGQQHLQRAGQRPCRASRCPSTARSRSAAGLTVEAFAVPGKVALYLESAGPDLRHARGRHHRPKVSEPATGAAFYYIPGCAAVDATLAARLGAPPWSSSTARSTLTRR